MSTVVAGKTFTARESFVLTDTDGSGCLFTSGGVTYYGIYSENSRIFYANDGLMTSYTKVYDSQDWEDESYKTITFAESEEPIGGDFETWFNAVYEEVTEDEVYLVRRSELEDMADAIREKSGGSSVLVFPAEFISAINAIDSAKKININQNIAIQTMANYCAVSVEEVV